MTNHQPIVRIRISQHRVRDTREVLHFAGDREASRSRRSASLSARLRRGRRCCERRHLTRGDSIDRDFSIGSERLIAGRRAVLLKNEGGDIEILLRAQTTGLLWRHGELHERQEFFCRAHAPRLHESRAAQWSRVPLSTEIGQMAACAVRLKRRSSCRRLLRRVYGGCCAAALLARDDDDAESRSDSNEY